MLWNLCVFWGHVPSPQSPGGGGLLPSPEDGWAPGYGILRPPPRPMALAPSQAAGAVGVAAAPLLLSWHHDDPSSCISVKRMPSSRGAQGRAVPASQARRPAGPSLPLAVRAPRRERRGRDPPTNARLRPEAGFLLLGISPLLMVVSDFNVIVPNF